MLKKLNKEIFQELLINYYIFSYLLKYKIIKIIINLHKIFKNELLDSHRKLNKKEKYSKS